MVGILKNIIAIKGTALPFIFWTVFLISSPLQAQIDTKIDTTQIKIGEPIEYSLTVALGPEDQIILPELRDTMSYHIEILEQQTDTLFQNNSKFLRKKLKVTSYDEGDFLIRSLPVIINSDTLLSHAFEISVEGVIIDSANLQGFPIKPIMDEKLNFRDYWNLYGIYAVAGILILGGVLTALLLWMKKRREEKLRSLIPKSPYEEAIDSLVELDKTGYLNQGKIQAFYTELSFILRRYLGRAFGFSSLELLSDDLLDYLKNTGTLTVSQRKGLKDFLYDSDLAKFAKTIPSVQKNELYREWVEQLVEDTRPSETEEEEEEIAKNSES